MDYLKRVLMLKRTEIIKENIKPLSVLSRIEIESGVGEFYISVVNLPLGIKGAKYYALVVDGKGREFEFDLGARPISYAKTFYELPSIKDGVAIGLYYIAEQIPVTLAFASQGSGICLTDFKKIVADKCLLRFKQILKEQEQEIIDEKQGQRINAQNESDYRYKEILEEQVYEKYNDEAVATENYYEIDDEIKQKLRSIKEKENENLFFENEYADSANKKTEKEKCNFVKGSQDEKNANFSQEDKGLEKTCIQNELLTGDNYYNGVKDELEQIYDLVKKGSYNDMITMNMSLLQLIKENLVDKEVAIEASDNKVEIEQMLRGAYHGTKETIDIQF